MADEEYTRLQHECEHDKCYDAAILLSHPPQRRWICRKCKSKGVDQIPTPDTGEYARLVRAAKEGAK